MLLREVILDNWFDAKYNYLKNAKIVKISLYKSYGTLLF